MHLTFTNLKVNLVCAALKASQSESIRINKIVNPQSGRCGSGQGMLEQRCSEDLRSSWLWRWSWLMRDAQPSRRVPGRGLIYPQMAIRPVPLSAVLRGCYSNV